MSFGIGGLYFCIYTLPCRKVHQNTTLLVWKGKVDESVIWGQKSYIYVVILVTYSFNVKNGTVDVALNAFSSADRREGYEVISRLCNSMWIVSWVVLSLNAECSRWGRKTVKM